MPQWVEYYGKAQSVRGGVLGLPTWARFVLYLVALPGIALLVLSIAAVLVSLATLLLVTVPVYRLLRAVTARPEASSWSSEESAGQRHVDAKVIE